MITKKTTKKIHATVMKTAHSIKAQFKTFSQALKAAWEQIKSVSKTVLKVAVSSWKHGQFFKKDYVRKNGKFIKLERDSKNHKRAIVSLEEGEEFDARGSIYDGIATRYKGHRTQSWAKFRNVNGVLKAFNFDNQEIDLPAWVK